MRKYMISVFLVLMMFLSTAVVTYAGSNVQVNTLNREVTVNGVNVASYCTDYPYCEYESTIYAPLAEENCNILGLSIVREEPNLVVLREIAPIQVNYRCPDVTMEKKNLEAVISDKSVEIQKANGKGGYETVELTTEMAEGKPMLEYNGMLYIPLTKKITEVALHWGCIYEDYVGLNVGEEIVPEAAATEIASTATANVDESAYNRALAQYIVNCNRSYTLESALQLLGIIKSKASAYGVDEKLIMAIIQTESTFRNVTSSGGAIGMMQIMASTGKCYGYSKQDLLNVEKNIEMGTMYIGKNIAAYGSVEKALVAYNQGGLAVSRGKTSSSYSQKVLSKYNAIVQASKGK